MIVPVLILAAWPAGQAEPPALQQAEVQIAKNVAPPSEHWIWGPGFSPDVNVYGNILARKDRRPVFDEDGNDVADVARIRQMDLILGSQVAERVDVLIALGVRSNQANTEYLFDIEQAFLRFESLPVFGELPSGLSALIGQYRTNFGRLNRERIYDIPQINRPRSLTQFFGETGYSQTGASGSYALPVSDVGAVQFTADYMDSGSPPLTIDDGGAVGGSNLRLSWIPSDAAVHGVEVGISRLHTRRADQDGRRSKLTGFDALYAWRPEADRPPALWLGGEFITSEIEQLSNVSSRPKGYYIWSQARLHDQWFVGARFDVSEELDDDTLETRTTGLYLTYLTNPGLRFAIGVERSQSDVELMDDVTRVFVELNFAVGTGPDRPFWLR